MGQGPYGKETCDTLVAAMTSDEYRDVLIVLAGYPHEKHAMFNSNSGLKSRFTNFFEFPDLEPDDCVAFFKMCADKDAMAVEKGVLDSLHDGIGRFKQLCGWANGPTSSRSGPKPRVIVPGAFIRNRNGTRNLSRAT